MECKGCDNKTQAVPYIAHEAALARMERTIRRLWILALVLIGLLLATNAGWIWYESQYETVTIDQEVQQEVESGNNQFIGGDYYGDAANGQD